VEDVTCKGRLDFKCPVQQNLLTVAAGSHGGDSTDESGSSSGAPTSEPGSSVTDLVIQLCMRLWGLLDDDSIIGTSDRPAAWLPTVRTYLENSLLCITSMLTAVEDAIAAVAGPDVQTPSQTRDSSSNSSRHLQSSLRALTTELQRGSAALQHGVGPPRQAPVYPAKEAGAAAQQLAALRPRESWAQLRAAIPTHSTASAVTSSKSLAGLEHLVALWMPP
jgi:hypothetical protein